MTLDTIIESLQDSVQMRDMDIDTCKRQIEFNQSRLAENLLAKGQEQTLLQTMLELKAKG